MIIKNWKKEILSIPNLLSLFRLALIPVYIIIYLNARQNADYFLAATILAISCITDSVDGKVARNFNMVTTLGKILDPLADKATQFALIICLATKHAVLWYVLTLFIIKELFQLIAASIKLKQGIILKGALLSGKICTAVLFCSLILLVLVPALDKQAVAFIASVDFFFLLYSFLNYLYVYIVIGNNFQEIDLT